MRLGWRLLMLLSMLLFGGVGTGFRGFGNVLFVGFFRAGGFARGFVIREDPMGQASGEAAWTTGCRLSAKRGTGRGLLEIGLTLFGLVLPDGFGRSLLRPLAILGQGLTRQNDVVLTRLDWSGRCGGRAITHGAAIVVAAGIALSVRRCIFGGRQVPAALMAAVPAGSSTAAAKATATPAPAIPTAIVPLASIMALASIVAHARRVIASRIVTGRKILRGGGVRIRLTFL